MPVPASGPHIAALGLGGLLLARAAERPGREALVELDRDGAVVDRADYAALAGRAAGWAASVAALGAPGGRVVVALPNGVDFAAAYLGCLLAGRIAVTAAVPRRRSAGRLARMIVKCRPDAVLCRPAHRPAIEAAVGAAVEAEPRVHRPAVVDAVPAAAPLPERAPAGEAPNALAMLQFTSGSSGDPKGVRLSHGNLMANARAISACFGHDGEATTVVWLPLHHDMGLISGPVLSLLDGNRCVLLNPVDVVRDPALWLGAIARYGARTSGGPNFIYDHCSRRVEAAAMASVDLSGWRVAFNGAEMVRPATLERFARDFAPLGFRREAFTPCYGLAEATLMVTAHRGGDCDLSIDAEALEAQARARPGRDRRIASVGPPGDGVEVRIVDPHGASPLTEGRVGEIAVGGPGVADGYWDDPETTAARFPVGPDGSRMLRTGDLGFLTQGRLYVTGRITDRIIVRGRNLAPEDIEATIEQACDFIQERGAVAFPVETDAGEQVGLAVEIRRDCPLADAEVTRLLRRVVTAAHDVPVAAIHLLSPAAIPVTTSGKKQRRLCGAMCGNGDIRGRRPVPEPDVPSGRPVALERTADQGDRPWMG